MKNFPKKNLNSKFFFIYGLGKTGKSVKKFLKKEKIKNIFSWDVKKKDKEYKKKAIKNLKKSDYIVMSPGISLQHANLKGTLAKNREKIISDLDLFFLFNNFQNTIMVTGTNGKSTTCKIIYDLIKNAGKKVNLVGNIGKPILNNINKKSQYIVIELSSFQLYYSKYIHPKYALLLNFSTDHLDWHKNRNEYLNAKLKIFSMQTKKDFAFVEDEFLISKFKKKKYKSKLIKIQNNRNLKLLDLSNKYLKSEVNKKNINFALELCKVLKIKYSSINKTLHNFKGLEHRFEIFKKKGKIQFINDSKSTTFHSTRFALTSLKNIYWILGGLPKKNDRFNLKGINRRVKKAYIIGKHQNHFKKQLKNFRYECFPNLYNASKKIFIDLKEEKNYCNVLLSPASASYDQYKNFTQRGAHFKKIIKNLC